MSAEEVRVRPEAARGGIANRERAASVMEREGLQALVATTPENIAYVIGAPLRTTNWSMQIYAVLPRDPGARPRLVLPTNRLGVIAQMGVPDAELYLFSDFFVEGSPVGQPSTPDIDLFYDLLGRTAVYPGPLEALAAALKDLDIPQGPLGVDEMRINPALYAKLGESLPAGHVRPAYGLFREVRQVKTPAEVARLRRSAELNERIEEEMIHLIADGVHEEELAGHYRDRIIRAGGTPAMIAVGAGPRSALPLIEHYFHRVGPGEQVRFDLCCQLDSYWADTGRTVVLGQPSEWQQRHFAAVRSGWERALELVRPGVKASAVFAAAVETVQRGGIPHYRRQHVGHAIGLELYDDIVLAPGDHRELQEGMVFCVEVPYYELGAGGFQIEDTVVVTKDGYEFLTHLDRKLFIQ
ncbi:M24 family metallopeptidase [Paenibacillus sp. TH7-28]